MLAASRARRPGPRQYLPPHSHPITSTSWQRFAAVRGGTNPADLAPMRCYHRGMSAKQHLYLVDGSAYIFRAYHRLPPLTDPEGTPVGAVYGYTTMLWKM